MTREELEKLSTLELTKLVMEELKKTADIINSLGREGQIQFLITVEKGFDENPIGSK